MEGIGHRTLRVNGINIHVAEKGDGPIVLFIHGFPELWYSWRHQIISLAARGYLAVAPDLRGYGDSDSPPSASDYSIFHLVGDLVALVHALGQDQVFVVGHDWGAIVAWWLCVLRPDMVKALVNLSVPYSPRNPRRRTVESLRAIFGDDYYMCRFQEHGAIEAEFEQIGTTSLIKRFLTYRTPAAIIITKEKGIDGSLEAPATLPSWLSAADVEYFANKFEKSGFTGGLNYYRCMDMNWELTAPWTGVQVKVPVKFIVGDLDLTYHTPGVQDYIHKGGFRKRVPFLQNVVVMEGAGHFINQERPQEISDHIYDFIKKF
ncbi:epoxide hydrolase A-like isoform X1 [Zingiber officinale]|uniref:epoxide hydrolase A-like isoform X1 n=1 Tax=Zingiber officinale TaxID=94328 RepID=UPI001C4D0C10|nr:epoxide hydrolase A-like isoform X1 [Zingiber officinale]